MMKTLLLSCILGLASAIGANAANIIFDGGSAKGHMFAIGDTRLPIGSIVRVGTLGEAGNASTFTEFARTAINNTGPNSPFNGYLRDGFAITDQAVIDTFKGKQIYLYVYNTTDGTAAGLAAAASGLFTSTEWLVAPGLTAAADQNVNIRLGGSSQTNPSTPALAATAVVGTYNVGTIALPNAQDANPNTSGGIYRLVPEPSTALLSGVLALFAMGRRKRNA